MRVCVTVGGTGRAAPPPEPGRPDHQRGRYDDGMRQHHGPDGNQHRALFGNQHRALPGKHHRTRPEREMRTEIPSGPWPQTGAQLGIRTGSHGPRPQADLVPRSQADPVPRSQTVPAPRPQADPRHAEPPRREAAV